MYIKNNFIDGPRGMTRAGLVASLFVLSTLSYSDARKAQLEEVIVTAQKKTESLQDAPISIKAFGAEQLEVLGIDGLGDIGAKVPGMTVEPFPINNATLRIFIRGVGIFDVQVTQDAPIGVYMDGVYIARSTGTAVDVADLERIEILKGPQGTLYGRNTTGGAINLITRRPSVDEFELKQKFTLGNRNRFSSNTMVNVPLSENIAAKLAYMYSTQDGYIDNTGPGGNFGDKDVQGLRLDLRWEPSENLTADYTYDRSDFNYHNYMYQGVIGPRIDKGQSDPVKNNGASATVFSDDRLDELSSGPPYEESRTEIAGHALTLDWQGENYQLKYIGAYRTLDDASYADLGGGRGSLDYRIDTHRYDGIAAQQFLGGPTPLVVPVISQSQSSHEFQFSQDGLFDGQLDYILGAYYFEEEATEDNSPLHHQFSGPVDDELLPLIGGPLFSVSDGRLVNFVSQHYEIENTAAALFGQFSFRPEVFDYRAYAIVGFRGSRDTRWARKNQTDLFYIEGTSGGQGIAFDLGSPAFNNPLTAAILAQAGFVIPQNRGFDNVVGESEYNDTSASIVLGYDVTDDINIYVKRVEGYKSGGFNTRDPQVDGNQGPASDGVDYGYGFVEGFDPEQVISYELGMKSEMLDRRLRLNMDIFKSTYEDLQAPVLINGTVADTKADNIGLAEMYGLETELVFALTADFFFMFNYTYLNTDVDIQGDPALSATLSPEVDFPSAPEHSATLGIDWTLLNTNWGRLNLNMDYSYIDLRKGLVLKGREGLTELPAFELLNARLAMADIPVGGASSLNVALWVKNIFDEEYELHAVDNLPHADRAVLWGEPRSYGLDIIYNY
ncbi:MAG: TonB-dependent receptor [Spongiibacteraceae bacterium]|nr:TonB-dependent receptor [Spongiibacteraceae bacterium]